MNPNEISIVDWFNPTNHEHLKAFKELQFTGTWPKEFWVKNNMDLMVIPTCWHYALMSKIVDHYLNNIDLSN